MVDGLGDGDAAGRDHAQEVGLVALAEHDIASEVAVGFRRSGDPRHLIVAELIEQLHVLEQIDVDHAGIVPTPGPLARTSRCRTVGR
jgi:hypothetical protein